MSQLTARIITVACVFAVLIGCTPATPTAAPTLPAEAPALTALPSLPTPTKEEAEESAEAIVHRLVSAKLAALQAKDIDGFLALLDGSDPEYITEQRNWFLIYQDAVTADFTIEVLRVEKIDATTMVAMLDQHYLYGPEKADRQVSYETKFRLTPAGWKEADLNYREIETPHFMIKYQTEVEDKAGEVGEEAEKAYASAVQKLGLLPKGKVTLKLFADQELLRQNTDIRVAYLFSGWAESHESIKLYARREKEAFARVIAHELVHKITLEITDSLNSWLAEGLAIYFGSIPFREGNVLHMGWYTAEDLAQPISWLEETNLIELTDERTIGLFNAVSSMVVEFMVDTYGLEKIHALLTELSKYPRYGRGYDYAAMEQENQKRLHQAIEAVFGVKMDTFNQQWIEWIRSQQQ
jgi:hypothetical protein